MTAGNGEHVLCLADVAFPSAPYYLLVGLQCDIDHDVVQHRGEQPRRLERLSCKPLPRNRGPVRTSVFRASSRSALAMLLPAVR